MAGVNVGVRIAEVLARFGGRGQQLTREAQALRGLEFDETARASQALRGIRDEEPNIGEDFLRDLQGKMRLSNQNNQVGDFIKIVDNNEKKKKRLLTRAEDFNSHFNSKQLQNKDPRYREIVNVENKNSIDDVKGLQTAYAKDTGMFKLGNTLYISGTGGKSGFGSKVNDVFSDIFLIPTHNVQFSEKYQDVIRVLEKHSDVTRLVGHSLAGSVLQEINNRNNQKYITTTYSAPFISFGNRQKNPHALRFRNQGDVISSLDRNAIQVDRGTINPVEAHKFNNMTTQGSFEQGVDDSAQVEQQINLNNSNEQNKV